MHGSQNNLSLDLQRRPSRNKPTIRDKKKVNKAIPEHLRWDIALGGLSIMAGLVSYSVGFVARLIDRRKQNRNLLRVPDMPPIPLFKMPRKRSRNPEHLRWDIALGGLSIMAGLVSYSVGFVALPFLLV
jgi:hypothetical protein